MLVKYDRLDKKKGELLAIESVKLAVWVQDNSYCSMLS